jgi:hypothetical protein
MKLKVALISIAICAISNSAFAIIHSKGTGQLIMHNFNIMPTPYNKKADRINCAQYSQQTYQLTTHNGGFAQRGLFQFGHEKFYSIVKNHGLISLHWSGVWTYIQPDGKKFHSAVYGTEVTFQGSNMKWGIYKNKYCQGSYQTTWSKQTNKNPVNI